MIQSRPFFFSLLCFCLLSTANYLQAGPASDNTLTFKQVWIAEAPPVSKVLAAYMVISNPSDEAMEILSATAEGFEDTAFHKTIMEGGVARMRHQSSLLIEAGKELVLEPGGMHMMLFNPHKPLKAGDSVILRFTLASGDIISTRATVKKAIAENHQHH